MKSMSWTSAPTRFPNAGSAAVPPVAVSSLGTVVAGTALPGRGSARLRAPEAITVPGRGTGLPFGGTASGRTAANGASGCTPAVIGAPARAVDARKPATQDFTTHHDATTLGIHSARRPPS